MKLLHKYRQFVIASVLLCCLPGWDVMAQAQPAALVVRTPAEWQAILDAGQPTPLDALSAYGKRQFMQSIRWGSKGLGGFSTTPLQRELNAAQLAAVLHFLDSAAYLSMLVGDLDGMPLRLPEPSPEVAARLVMLQASAEREQEARRQEPAAATALPTSSLMQLFLEQFGAALDNEAMRRVPAGDLPLLFDAAHMVSVSNPASPAIEYMLLVHAEMVARGIDTRRTFDGHVVRSLIAAHAFERARQFSATRPHLKRYEIPNAIDPLGPGFKGRSVFEVDAVANTITRQSVPPPVGLELVMVVDAACHFSRDALKALHDDAALLARLQQANLMLVTPPRSPVAIDFMRT